MKKLGLLLLAVVMTVGLAGCGGDGSEPERLSQNRITSPSGGTWILGEDRIIEWEAEKNDQTIGTLYINTAEMHPSGAFTSGVISSAVPVSSRSFSWRVGVLEGGNTLSPGRYRIYWQIPLGPNSYEYSGSSGSFSIKSNR